MLRAKNYQNQKCFIWLFKKQHWDSFSETWCSTSDTDHKDDLCALNDYSALSNQRVVVKTQWNSQAPLQWPA